MTTANIGRPPKISLLAPPVDTSQSQQPDRRVTRKDFEDGFHQRISRHGTYGGRVNSAATPYAIASPPASPMPEDTMFPAINSFRRLTDDDRRSTDDVEEDSDDDISRDDTFPHQSLSTIPEVPSTIRGTSTPSAITEIGPSEKNFRKFSAGSGFATTRLFGGRTKKLTINGIDSYATTRSDHNCANNDAGGNELSDFRYVRKSPVEAGSVQRGRVKLEQSISTSSSSSSSGDTRQTGSWSDNERLFHESKKRKLYVVVAVVISVVVVVILVAVIVLAVLLTRNSSAKNGNSVNGSPQDVTTSAYDSDIFNQSYFSTSVDVSTRPSVTYAATVNSYRLMATLNRALNTLIRFNVSTAVEFNGLFCEAIIWLVSVNGSSLNVTNCSTICSTRVDSNRMTMY